MTTITQVLEQMGQDAKLQNSAQVKEFIEHTELSIELKNALITKDTVSLERQMDVCPDIVCFLVPAEDDQPAEDDSKENSDTNIKSIVNG